MASITYIGAATLTKKDRFAVSADTIRLDHPNTEDIRRHTQEIKRSPKHTVVAEWSKDGTTIRPISGGPVILNFGSDCHLT